MQVASASSEPAPKRERSRRLRVGAAAAGLATAVLTALCIGAPVYRTTAVIAVPNADPLGRVAIVRSAVAGAVSKTVIRRAAVSLLGTGSALVAPSGWARLAPSIGGASAKASASEVVLARALAGAVVASPGAMSGTIEIAATSPTAEDAAAMASAMADAFVAEQDEGALQARQREEAAITTRIEALQTAAIAAHRRLTDLGGNMPADAATARAAAAAQTQVALARRDAIKAILAAGSPPLGDGEGVPATIDAIQKIYLEQMRQLAQARETLGERHTTVVSLTGSVEREAAKLTTEWRRLKATADAEVSAAHDREDALRKAAEPSDIGHRTAIAEARAAAQRADSAFLRAEAAAADTLPDNPFHVIARPPVPVAPDGPSTILRALLSALAGLLASAAWLKAKRLTSPAPRRAGIAGREEPAQPTDVAASKAVSRPKPPARIEPKAPPPPAPHIPAIMPEADMPKPAVIRDVEPQVPQSLAPEAPRSERAAAVLKPERIVPLPNLPSDERPRADETLKQALRGILPTLGKIAPAYGTLPTVIIAANEIGISTAAAALALGYAAAGEGYRVLIIESARPRPDLARAADPQAEPILIDMFGGLRVALKEECCAGTLFLAPCFRDGPRIASALARGGGTPFVDDVAEEFDLIVIDGGRAADAAAEDWGADIALRVARFASTRDDDRLVATLGLVPEALLGTIAGSMFLARAVATIVEDPAPVPAVSDVVRPFVVHRPVVQQQRPRSQAPRSTMRRRVGLR